MAITGAVEVDLPDLAADVRPLTAKRLVVRHVPDDQIDFLAGEGDSGGSVELKGGAGKAMDGGAVEIASGLSEKGSSGEVSIASATGGRSSGDGVRGGRRHRCGAHAGRRAERLGYVNEPGRCARDRGRFSTCASDKSYTACDVRGRLKPSSGSLRWAPRKSARSTLCAGARRTC